MMNFMRFANLPQTSRQAPILALNFLHILNDGFSASYALLLPFIAASQHLSLTQVGSLGTVLNVASIGLAVPAGYIATKLGGLKTLVIGLGIYGAALLGAGVLGHYYLLLVMFAIGGAGFGIFHPIAFALIAKWSPKATRGRAMGNFTAIGDVGRVGISAALSFVVVYLGWRFTAMVYALVALGLAGIFSWWLRSRSETIAAAETPVTPLKLREIVRNRRYVLAVSTAMMDAFASSSLYIFLPFLLLKRGVSPAFLGTFTAVFFVGNFMGKMLLGRFVDKSSGARVFIVSELLMAMFIFLLANSTPLYVIVLCSLVLGAFTKGTLPVLQTMISESVEHHGNFEKAFGMSALTAGISITLAPLTLGVVSDHAGIVTAFNVMAGVALCATVPAVGYALARRRFIAASL